mmetsp:Transcript_9879/g.25116  ORF Transcript_9879/g.25116 Transcript_9879/m.25116 type:complete len:124 (-) Transcript_9879:221-592(-)
MARPARPLAVSTNTDPQQRATSKELIHAAFAAQQTAKQLEALRAYQQQLARARQLTPLRRTMRSRSLPSSLMPIKEGEQFVDKPKQPPAPWWAFGCCRAAGNGERRPIRSSSDPSLRRRLGSF